MERVVSVKKVLASVAHFLRSVTWKEDGPDGVGAGNPSRLSERVKVMASQVDKVGADFEVIVKENQELKEEVNQLRSQLDPEVGLGKRKEREEEGHDAGEGVKRPCVEEAAVTSKRVIKRTYNFMVCPLCDRKFIFELAFQAHLKTHQDRDAQLSASSTSGPDEPQHGEGHDQGGEEKGDTVVLEVSSDDDEPENDIESQNEPKKPESQPLENSASQVVGGEPLTGIQAQDKQDGSSLADSSASSGFGTGLEEQDQGSGMSMGGDNSAAAVDGDSHLSNEEGGLVEMKPDENSFRIGSEIQGQIQQQVLPPPPIETPCGNPSPVGPGITSTAAGEDEAEQDNMDEGSGPVDMQESTPASQDFEKDDDLSGSLSPD